MTSNGTTNISKSLCPKCGHLKANNELECPKCGIIYEKYEKFQKRINEEAKADRDKQNKKKQQSLEKKIRREKLKLKLKNKTKNIFKPPLKKGLFTLVLLSILALCIYFLLSNKNELGTFRQLTLGEKIDAIDNIWLSFNNNPKQIKGFNEKKQEIIFDEYKSLEFKEQRKILNHILAECAFKRRDTTQQHALLVSISTNYIVKQGLKKQIDWAISNIYARGFFDKLLHDKIAENVNFAMTTNDPNLSYDMLKKYVEALKLLE